MFRAWHWQRNRIPGFDKIHLDLDKTETYDKDDVVFALSRFICEVRKKNGDEFPPKTLKHIIITVQMHFHGVGFAWYLLEDPDFLRLAMVLDNKMKENASKGLGRIVRKAEPLDADDIKMMWEKGVLGEDSPRKLSDTVLFLLGLNFALRAGQEHKNLRRPGFDPQIKLVVDDGEEVLEYTEDLSTKTNKGGLKNGNMLGKSSCIYPAENPEHCPVHLYKKYLEQLPPPGKYKELYLQANSNK